MIFKLIKFHAFNSFVELKFQISFNPKCVNYYKTLTCLVSYINSFYICVDLKFSCRVTCYRSIGLKLYEFVSYIKLVCMM